MPAALRRPAIGVAVGVLLGVAARAQSFEWRLAAAHGFGPCQMTFDSVRNRLVALGDPIDRSPSLTIEWDGGAWLRRPTAVTPTPRAGYSLAFDARRGRVVLFGGTTGSSQLSLLDDTWEYDGADWIDRSPAFRPFARRQAAMSFDPQLGEVLLAGGRALGPYNDCWSWNGTRWLQLPGTVPQLTVIAMAWHPSTARTVLVGNRGSAAETWTFDGATWSLAAAATPFASDYRATTDAAGDRVVLLPALATAPSTWNGSVWTPMAAPFDGRSLSGLAADLAGNVIAFAGQRLSASSLPQQLNDTWRLADAGHLRIDEGGPGELFMPQVAYDSLRQRLVAVGGNSPSHAWEFDGMRWHDVGAPLPAATFGARMCFDLARARTVRFGGASVLGGLLAPTNDLSEWDGSSWTVPAVTPPPARHRHAMTYSLVHGATVLFGGVGVGNTVLGDTWVYDGTSWTQPLSSGPVPRSDAAMVADIGRGVVVMFGGRDASLALLDDTWEWDGSNWHQRSPASHPVALQGVSMCFDLQSLRVLLTGSISSSRVDQWLWNGIDWRQLSGGPPRDSWPASSAVLDDGLVANVSQFGTWIGREGVATARVVGIGCGGFEVPALRCDREPVLGRRFVVTLHRATPSVAVTLGIGIGLADRSLAGACSLYLPQLDALLPGASGIGGYAEVPLAVPAMPAMPALVGLEVSLQAAVLDGQGPLGFSLTNGLVARLGL